MLSAAIAVAGAADAASVSVALSRTALFWQSSGGTVLTENHFRADAIAWFDEPQAGVTASLQKPNGTVGLPVDEDGDYARSDTYDDPASFRSGYPNGTYRFRFSGTFAGNYAITLRTFSPPSAAVIQNIGDARSIDPDVPFTFRWSLPADVRADDTILFYLESSDGSWSSEETLPSLADRITLTLPENKAFIGFLVISRTTGTTDLSGGGIGVTQDNAFTVFEALTRARPPVIITEQPVHKLRAPVFGRVAIIARTRDPAGTTIRWQRKLPGSTDWQDFPLTGSFDTPWAERFVLDNVQPDWDGHCFRMSASESGTMYYSEEAVLTLAPAFNVATLAGRRTIEDIRNGTGVAYVPNESGVAADWHGNIYTASTTAVRVVTPTREVIQLAGSDGQTGYVDGHAFSARFREIAGLVAATDRSVYVTERLGHTVRRVDWNGDVTTVIGEPDMPGSSDGTAGQARLQHPTRIARDRSGHLYVIDGDGTQRVRRLGTGGNLTTIPIPGPALGPILGFAVDSEGAFYVSDGTPGIRRFLADGTYATLAGSPRTYRWIAGAGAITVDPFDHVLVSDGDQAIVRLETDGSVTLLVGRVDNTFYYDGTAGQAEGCHRFIAAMLDGSIAIADPVFRTIRRATPATPPAFTAGPISTSADTGASLTLSAAAPDILPGAYRWFRDGVEIHGATGPQLTIPYLQPNDAGTYTVLAFDGSTFTSGPAATVTVPEPALPPGARVSNLSTRAITGSDGVIIPGFVIQGTDTKRLLIRTVGPGLGDFGVDGTLPDPRMTLLVRQGPEWVTLTTNEDWDDVNDSDAVAFTAAKLGAFPLEPGARDSAIVADLSAGLYTVLASDASGRPGVALVELFDADADGGTTRLMNISTRGHVGGDGNIMIPGFVVADAGPRKVLIRAVGPTLASLGVDGVLADPELQVFRTLPDGASEPILANDNWSARHDALKTAAVSSAVGAFALPWESADAALVAILQPGVYTVHARGVAAQAGVALVEIYIVP